MSKILTLEQMSKLPKNSVVWEEVNHHQDLNPMIVSKYARVIYDEDGEISILPDTDEIIDGDKRRRFWDDKPTRAEREAEPW